MSKSKSRVTETVGAWELTGPAGSLRFKVGEIGRAVNLYAEHFDLDSGVVAVDVERGVIQAEEWDYASRRVADVHGGDGASDNAA